MQANIFSAAVSFNYLRMEEFLLGGRQCSHYLGLNGNCLLLLNSLFLFTLEYLLLILQRHLVCRFARLLTAHFERVCSVHEQVLYYSYEAPLLHFFHIAILSAEIHKNGFTVRILVDVSAVSQ